MRRTRTWMMGAATLLAWRRRSRRPRGRRRRRPGAADRSGGDGAPRAGRRADARLRSDRPARSVPPAARESDDAGGRGAHAAAALRHRAAAAGRDDLRQRRATGGRRGRRRASATSCGRHADRRRTAARCKAIERGKVRIEEESIDFYGDRQRREVVMELAADREGEAMRAIGRTVAATVLAGCVALCGDSQAAAETLDEQPIAAPEQAAPAPATSRARRRGLACATCGRADGRRSPSRDRAHAASPKASRTSSSPRRRAW